MKIGIIGAGRIGAALAQHFVHAGHEVAISNSRDPSSLKALVGRLGANARSLTAEEAAVFGEVVLLAVPWRAREAFPSASSVAGKIVIDATNPYGADGSAIELGDQTSSEIVARRLPGATVVKAFNTLWFKHLEEKARPDLPRAERIVVFLAGDEEGAKDVVASIIDDIGFTPVDTGSLRDGGRRQGPGSSLYGRPITEAQSRIVLGEIVSGVAVHH